MTSQVIDKGRIVIAVDKYPEKQNGQQVLDQQGQPKFKNKWMAVGEATKWRNGDGSEHTNEKVYLRPVNVNGTYFEQRTFWDSQDQNNSQNNTQQNNAQQGSFQQSNNQSQHAPQNHPQQGGYNQNNQ